jgi:hypothetical protein
MRQKISVFVAICIGCFCTSVAIAAESRQSSTFHLGAPADEVKLWIAHHVDELTEAAGATIISKTETEAKLRVDDSQAGHFGYVVRRRADGNKFTETMIKRLFGPIEAYETTIVVEPSDRECVVKVETSASIENLNRIKMAAGLRRRLRGVRDTFDRQFTITSTDE